MTDNSPIIGRFAPSPTGPLHQGSLVAALGSYLLAKQVGGQWLLRIEDLDPPREVPGAAQQIIETLQAFGLQWDGDILYQSQRTLAYQKVFKTLFRHQLVYPCDCSRKQIQQRNQGVYDGYCRSRTLIQVSSETRDSVTNDTLTDDTVTDVAWRFRFDEAPLAFTDQLQGPQEFNRRADCQDFIVKRRDGLFAYQLAVVVDDHFSGVNQVVRGADILDSTPRQIALYRQLGWAVPQYYHLPLVLDESGQKLSKSRLSASLDRKEKSLALVNALCHLGQNVPSKLKTATCGEIIEWALENFVARKIPRISPA